MADAPPKKPRLWPVIFLLAFVLGAIMWGVWMAKFIRTTSQQREQRETNNFFVPMNTNAVTK